MIREMTWIVVMTAVALGVAPAYATADAEATRIVRVGERGHYTSVSPAALAKMLERKDVLLVNVHIPYEGDIAGTGLSIAFDQVASSVQRLPADRDARIVVYCRSGRMSAAAASTLVDLGYRQVSHLDGGMIAWERAGYGLVKRRSE